MEDPELRVLLKEEYMRIQAFIESFDGKAITVKAWSVTFSLATMLTAVVSKDSMPAFIAAWSALSFWITEAYIRAYQYAYYDRLGEIERYFRGEKKGIHALQLGASWSAKFSRIGIRKIWNIMSWPEVALPHALPVILAVGYVLLK